MQYIEASCNFSLVACLISLGVGAFLFEIAAAKDGRNNLREINKSAKTHKNQQKILSQLGDYFKLHSNMKQLSNKSTCFWHLIKLDVNLW